MKGQDRVEIGTPTPQLARKCLLVPCKETQNRYRNAPQADILKIKIKQSEHYADLTGKKEKAALKTQLSAGINRINTLEQFYKKTYSFREKERKIKKANNIIIRGGSARN